MQVILKELHITVNETEYWFADCQLPTILTCVVDDEVDVETSLC